MTKINNGIVLHPQLLDLLFTFKSKLYNVFSDVLGLHDIHHIAITHINEHNELLTLSSTPSLEFNLFKSNLWQFDDTYEPCWFELCSNSSWQSLYSKQRYDELYYLKQVRHGYPLGLSLSAKLDTSHIIYSIASRNNCIKTHETFKNEQDNLYKIGKYCSKLLLPLVLDNAETISSRLNVRASL